MRLTCPNCDAQYEVPDNVVPVEGRDVQCSNCGQTWFQHHADHMPPEDALALDTDAGADLEPPAEIAKPEPQPDQPPEPPQPEPPAPVQENKGLDDLDDLEELPPRTVTAATPVRRAVDPAVADILQQEAEAERAARNKAAPDPLESQPDLGLADTDDAGSSANDRTAQARQRMARLRGEPEPMSDADVNAAAVSSRRDLLPDIDEINSSLRTENSSTGGQAEIDAPSTKKRKQGFRRGFMLMLILFVVLAALYIFAPQISQAVPAVETMLNGYVAWIDGLRTWLDGHVQNLLRGLDTMATQSSAG